MNKNLSKLVFGVLCPPLTGNSSLQKRMLRKKLTTWLNSVSYFVCVDGALNHVPKKYLNKCIAWVGDGDSLKEANYFKRSRKETYSSTLIKSTIPNRVKLSCDKSESDLGVALQWTQNWLQHELSEQCSVSLEVFGAWGGRFDHHLAAMDELRKTAQISSLSEFQLKWISNLDESCAWWISFDSKQSKLFSMSIKRGTKFSVFGTAKVISLNGCKYGINMKRPGFSSGTLSNVMTGSLLKIRAIDGEILLILA